MRILVYADFFSPSIGGIESSNHLVVTKLAQLGHDVQLIVFNATGIAEYAEGLDVETHIAPIWSFATMNSLTGIFLNTALFRAHARLVHKVIRRFHPQGMIMTENRANLFWGGWAERIGVPYVSYSSTPRFATRAGHASLRGRIRYGLWQRVLRSYRAAAALLVASESTRQAIRDAAPELATPIGLAPHAVDDAFLAQPADPAKAASLRQQYGIPEDHFVLLTVTRVTEDKGVDDGLRAITGLPRNERDRVTYLIVGDGPDRSKLEHLRDALGLGRHAIFAGTIDHREVVDYFDIANVFLLPSRRGKMESFGIVFAEAGARGKPSIAYRVGGVPEVIDHEQTGFVLPMADTNAMRDRIHQLLHEPELARGMGHAARDKVERCYSSETFVRSFEAHLAAAAARTDAPALQRVRV